MINETDKELIERLIKGTQLKKVVWERTSRESEYKTTLGSSSITTDNWNDQINHIMKVDFAIWNSNGDNIYTITADTRDENYDEIMKLYVAAKSSYLKVDETISDIMSHRNK